jgi:hypothetical protein
MEQLKGGGRGDFGFRNRPPLAPPREGNQKKAKSGGRHELRITIAKFRN